MHKLLTPGPVPVPEFVLKAIQQDVIHHRSETFYQFYSNLLERLRYLFQAKIAGTMIGSGTYGVGAMIYSLFRQGEKVLVVNNGKFSGRWVDDAKMLGLETLEISVEWGQSVGADQILERLKADPDCQGLVLTHSETSTGAVLDVEEIAFAVKQTYPDILIVVDGITSVGAMPYYHDSWGIDGTITASQKALMNPAGTVAFALSEAARDKLMPTHGGDVKNLWNYMKALEGPSYPYTAPVQLLYGLDSALEYIQREGLPEIWHRCHQSSKTFRNKLAELGGEIFPAYPTDSLTAFRLPLVDPEQLKKQLASQFAWTLSSGQGKLKGEILRISHMGTSQSEVMEAFLKDVAKLI